MPIRRTNSNNKPMNQSEDQIVTLKTWHVYAAIAAIIFATGGAWVKLDYFGRALEQFISNTAQQRERQIESNIDLQRSIIRFEERIKAIEQRLASKNIIGLISTTNLV